MCLLSFTQIVMPNLVLLFVIIPVVAFFWLRFLQIYDASPPNYFHSVSNKSSSF